MNKKTRLLENQKIIQLSCKKKDYSELNLRNKELEQCSFKRIIFDKVDFSYSDIIICYFTGCDFQHANLKGAKISGKITGGDFFEATINEATIYSEVTATSFSYAIAKKTKFIGNIINCDFNHADLSLAKFKDIVIVYDTYFHKTKFSADCKNATFINCSFIETDFKYGDFSQATFIKCNFSDCIIISAQFQRTTFRDCNFSKVTFESDLSQADFKYSDLRAVCFENAILDECDFKYCDLSKIKLPNLISIDLRFAILHSSDLSDVKVIDCLINEKTILTNANCNNTQFRGIDFHNVEFKDTRLENSIFDECKNYQK